MATRMIERRAGRTGLGWIAACAALLAAGVSGVAAADEGADKSYADKFDVAPGDWASTGSNPYFILQPGYTLVLEGKEDGQTVHLVIEVLNETRTLAGVETRVVRETESFDGVVKEDTRDYYAMSKKTNDVFYFGEEVDNYKDGKIASHHGSWLAGENGARFGLMMPGSPVVGFRHYQEVAPGHAMDRAEVASLSESYETPAGRFDRCLKTAETTPLEPDVHESKLYAPGIGLIQDGGAKLLRHGYSVK